MLSSQVIAFEKLELFRPRLYITKYLQAVIDGQHVVFCVAWIGFSRLGGEIACGVARGAVIRDALFRAVH